ncbi:MAG: CoA pyrophosphatase [Candidatus Bathyarchaeia archaeon]
MINAIKKGLKPFSDFRECAANAVVSILLRVLDSDIYLLAVKRVESSKDPWSGHFSLPGGKRESKDRDLLETVVRETMEEIGVDLRESIFLGVVEPERSQLNPNIIVLPFVFLLEKEPTVNLNRCELERDVWVPISALLNNERIIEVGSNKHPAFIVGDIVIWGLTYRILKKVLQGVEETLSGDKSRI